ncbi:MAG: phosphoglycerate kinase, partial [Candidatus Taylorbacteria bacterium]|nr:phosphoglycerate kinase [Candidatus Taylorbacteria bacterium]
GISKRSNGSYDFSEIVKHPALRLPKDVLVENKKGRFTKKIEEVLRDDAIVDAGIQTVASLKEAFTTARYILWNGTLGIYEKGFVEGTEALAQAITESGVKSVVGGGDTLASISGLHLLDKFSFVSTGGGSMLDFLANEALPGIQALEEKQPERV